MRRDNCVPHQIQQLINDMLNGKENIHLRGNYRVRLDEIREEIDKAISKYDLEVQFSDGFSKPNRKGQK